ncbi:transcriptional regulator [Streptomyces spiroverticillatus]|uniref:Transcriptional regulator n=1 Tax=Streptomyces finlayi TaxID=67296 RepID=A0A919CC69_9ACTN|nr:HEAT repeat domain-containing protein [Streptomyces finlayi]GHA21883.1 transcriptional regulator [Streptomyces spiroverticillatus]GHD04069.1 transcriptional regulator [Streptomyces finlayi]
MLIGEVARRSGVSARMLRHYESLGLVRPSDRNGSGYREYAAEDIRRVFHIESLRSLGLSLRDVGRALDDPGFTPSELVADLIRQTRERIAAETELLDRLSRIDAAGPTAWEDVLQTTSLLQALGSKSAGRRQSAVLSSSTEDAPVEALVEAALNEREPNVAGALRWALARADESPSALLAKGLASPTTEIRRRAARTLAAIPDAGATGPLREALTHRDHAVRRIAALALGARGLPEAIPVLLDMVVQGLNDVDAADTLTTLANLPAPGADPAPADLIAAGLVERVARSAKDPLARRRLTQALADIPGPLAAQALTDLTRDGDPGVALTATYLLGRRATG